MDQVIIRVMSNTLKTLEREYSAHRSSSDYMVQSYVETKFRHEMTDGRMTSFATDTDLMRWLEMNYRLLPEELEIMRMSRMFRMHKNGNCISFDDFCENKTWH